MANRGRKVATVTDFIFLSSKITAVTAAMKLKDACSWKKSYDKPKQHILKSQDITWLTKDHRVKAMVFPVVMYGCENWTIKKAERQRIDTFERWCWRRLWRVPWTARRSNQSILKEITEYSLEGLTLKLKLQYFGHLIRRGNSLERRWGWERWRAGGEGDNRGWHHQLNGHEFEQTPGDGEGQGSLMCCSPWGCKELDTTEQLNNK